MRNTRDGQIFWAAIISLVMAACGTDDGEPASPILVSAMLEPARNSALVIPEELRTAHVDTIREETRIPDLFSYTAVPQGNLVASSGQSDDEFGNAVAIDGDRAVICAYRDDSWGTDSGACYLFGRQGSTWTQEAKLIPPDGAAGDAFGSSVALNDTTAIIGAPGADISGSVDCGAAYTFTKNGPVWGYQTKLTADDGMAGDQFGHSVALTAAGAAVGAIKHDSQATDAGAVYMFARTNNVWSTPTKITASDGIADDQFGQSVALSLDTVVVGSSFADIAGRANQGAVYAFVSLPMNQWAQSAKFTATDGQSDDRFGHSVSLVNTFAAVGAPFDDDPIKGIDAGSMYVFVRNAMTWSQVTKIIPNDGAASDQFGTSVALLEGPPLTAIAGAPKDDDMGSNSGSAYVFEGSVMGTWAQQVKITANAGATQDEFGTSVALSNMTVIAGAFGDDVGANPNQGSAYAHKIGRTNADSCVFAAECLSGYCVDGLCCNSECSGTCQACTNTLKGFGADGVCGSIVYGKAPENPDECPTDFANSPCGLDGTCDGAGQCRKVVPGTSCPGVSTCSNGKTIAPICNGLGACVDDIAVSCTPYLCDASGTMCTTSCSNDAGCTVGNYCSNGACTEQIEIGTACTTNSQCKSRFCVDGVCCSTPCNGPCQVCASALQGGIGVDGYCGNAAEGTNPGNRCLTQDPTTCGTNGTCSAGGVCHFYPNDTPCGDPVCENNGVSSKFCNGTGTCLNRFEPCGSYLCTETGCKKPCSTAADCIEGTHCNAGTCVTDGSLGAACTADIECTSGHCVQGQGKPDVKLCCSNSCANTGDPCGFVGLCNTVGACELHKYGDTCGPALCNGALKYGGQICNGLGACLPDPGNVESCFPYICDTNGTCKTSCIEYGADSTESDCTAGFFCQDGQCVAVTKSCASVDDCTTGEICDAEKNYCVPRPEILSASESCDCHTPGRSSNRSGLSGIFALTLVLLAQRRRAPNIR